LKENKQISQKDAASLTSPKVFDSLQNFLGDFLNHSEKKIIPKRRSYINPKIM
jgi:hypothetical protein